MVKAGQITLKDGRDGPVQSGNPWIFSQAIDRVEPSGLEPGELVEVRNCRGALLGVGHYNPKTTIAVRMLTWGEDGAAAEQWLEQRFRAAAHHRRAFVGDDTTCYRLVNGEGDGLPGLVVDRYADVLVTQFLSAGMDRMREQVVNALMTSVGPRSILERSVGAVRRHEGLEDRVGRLAGEDVGEVIALENQIRVVVDIERGQKTGYFLDQRDNRARLSCLARDARVLDGCCYEGGFGLAALKGGARRVVAVDTSARALALAETNRALNGADPEALELVKADLMEFLSGTEERFDLIVLDPPPLARSRADGPRAERYFVELNRLALGVLADGGGLMTFSCSTHFRNEDFMRALRLAQARAGRRMRLTARLGAAPDHPVMLGHIEGEYLTGALLEELK
jgi:23S rRNA (cytosine1962-C5)-methyltransferase